MENKTPQHVIDKARENIVAVVGQYVELQKDGTEYKACCPFHQEKTPSFSVEPIKQFFYCFGCGESGDAIDFVQKHQGVNFHEALKIITGEIVSTKAGPTPAPAREREPEEWQVIYPVPENAPAPPSEFSKKVAGSWLKFPLSMRWAYHDADGNLIGYTARYELPGGGKDVIPQTYCVNSNTGEERWRWKSFDRPRPMYGLEKLARHPNAQVMIVEGEKTADAGQQLFIKAGIPMDAVITMAWPGGAKAIKYIDWSPLSGRKVGLWPDADLHDYGSSHVLAGHRMPFLYQPGTTAMLDIYDTIKDSAAVVKFIIPPTGDDYKCGWDLADADESWPLLAHLKSKSIMAAEVRERFPVDDEPEPAPPVDDTPPWDGEPTEFPDEVVIAEASSSSYDPDEFSEDLQNNGNFSILGYDQDEYFFFCHEKRQVLARKAGQFTDTGLNELAPLQWWEAEFPGDKGGFNRKMAVNWIFRTANARGIYDPSRVRGRGAWIDKGRHVFHLGNFLVVDGKGTDITRIDSSYVYPMARATLEPASDLMSDEEGRWLASVARKPRWTSPSSAALIAGFVMLSPICGALNWRPHVWITGGAGSGKTSVQAKYVGALTRGIHVHANGNSTEAGIRQELKADALPVLVDEFESNNDREKQRVENVMSMIRQTSSETQARTLKGTVTGDSQHYQIRSMFCLASINTNLPTKADVDRLSVLGLRAPKAGEKDNWPELEADLNKIDLDLEISSRLLARSLSMMPIIMDTVKAFRRVAATQLGRQRDADQYGTLLAGYWCLMNSYVPTDEEITAVLNDYSFSEHMEDSHSDDAGKALDALINAKIRVGGTLTEYSVFELVRATSTKHRRNTDPETITAMDTLVRHGIRPEIALGELWFGITVPSLVKLAKDLPSATDLRGQLMRLDGAKKVSTKKYMGTPSRGVSIPLWDLLDEEVEETEEGEKDAYPF